MLVNVGDIVVLRHEVVSIDSGFIEIMDPRTSQKRWFPTYLITSVEPCKWTPNKGDTIYSVTDNSPFIVNEVIDKWVIVTHRDQPDLKPFTFELAKFKACAS